MQRMTAVFAIAVVSLAATCAGPAAAQAYPTRPIRIIVPAAPGGNIDLLTRAVTSRLGDHLGQPFVIENRPGATTSIAEEYVVKSPPDGYTLLMSGMTLATQPFVRANLPYDPLRDLAMISLIATSGNVIVVNSSVPAKSVAELIALGKASAKPMYYGTPVFGATAHLAAEMFNQMAGVKFVQVPYKGGAPALQGVLSEQIEMTFANIPEAISLIRSGRVRALAVTSAKRDRQLPDVPTVAEAGLPGYEIVAWFGMVGPARLPEAIVNRISAEAVKTLKDPVVIERLDRIGFDLIGTTPAEFRAYVKSEVDKLGQVIRAAGIKAE